MIQTDSPVVAQILEIEGHRARHSNRIVLQQSFLFGTVQVHVIESIHIDGIH